MELVQTLSSEHPAYRDLTLFKSHIYNRYQHAHHLIKLDDLLTRCSLHAETMGREGCGHAVIQMPPRHGKTLTISRLYPPWHLGKNPDHRVILASYGASLAKKNSRYTRNVLLLDRYHAVFPGVHLAGDSASAEAWDIAGHDGGLDAMGVGGGVTGKGGHIIIVDDPVKSREEAESETYRDKVWDWFTDDLYTRREPGAAVIVVMTRWHQDDLVGRLLRDQPGTWEVLDMPALNEAGAALWPERYDLPALERIQRMIGDYAWSALYQQSPVPAAGGVFKRAAFHVTPLLDEVSYAVRYWDLAMSEKTSADYTAGVKIGRHANGRLAVLDVQRVRKDWGDVVPYIAQIAALDGPGVPIGVEQAGYMSRAVQDLSGEPGLHNHSIWGYAVDKDKLTRALPFAARVAAEQVDVLESSWTTDYLDELCSFPYGAHDDQVDASSGAYAMLGSDVLGGGMNYADDSIGGAY